MIRRIFLISSLVSILALGQGGFSVFAQSAADEVQSINDQISGQKARLEQIQQQIETLKRSIEKKQQEARSLQQANELLENRIEKTELEIDAANKEIALVTDEIRSLETQRREAEEQLARQRELLERLLQKLEMEDRVSNLTLFFGEEPFSRVFDQWQYLNDVRQDVQGAVTETRRLKADLDERQAKKEAALASVKALEQTLSKTQERLEGERIAKEQLLVQTRASEANYATLVRELRQESQAIDRELASLQSKLEKRLLERDLSGESTLLSWPFIPPRGISAGYHDREYPYRHLFEHSGIDLPTSVGTPVGAAAPGYVAWTREGRSYGYYVLVVHANGIATLYAHLSKILVEPDQFVSRGESVGLSGGRPGMRGAGLSTGPHLHFEVRKNGIPVNPMPYLMPR